jgi:hypothetical protein
MRDPLSKIAQGAFDVDECPVKGCDYIPRHYAGLVMHMRDEHDEDVHEKEEQ